jgi:hypothetical protein
LNIKLSRAVLKKRDGDAFDAGRQGAFKWIKPAGVDYQT